MRKLRLLALCLAIVMSVAVLASCGGDTPVTFATLLSPASPTLDDVVTKMEAIPELDGYTRMAYESEDEWGDIFTDYYDSDSEFRFFRKLNAETNKYTYKVFSLRNARVVATFTNTDDVSYSLSVEENDVPAFTVKKTEIVWLNAEKTESEYKNTVTMYDAIGATIVSKINDTIDDPYTFFDWVVINRDIYTVNETSGAFAKKTTVPKNLAILDEDDAVFVGNNIYVNEYSESIQVYDIDFNYVAEWFPPVNVSGFEFFVLNDANVLIQYSKRLAPDAKKYDIYEGYNSNNMVKYDVVTEIFNIQDQTTKNVDCDVIIEGLYSSNALKEMLDKAGKDPAQYIGEFENIATTYPIEDKKINQNDNVMDIVMVDNNGKIGSSLKLVANQNGIPEKIAENLYQVPTTYGYALTDVEGNVIKKITRNSLSKVGEYLYDSDGIYDLKYETVYDFDANNAVCVGVIDNTIFVKQYTKPEKTGDYTVLAFSKGEAKEICKFVKDNENNVIFSLNTYLNVYCLYNQETKLYTYYNADGTVLLKDFTNEIIGYNSYMGGIAWYTEEINLVPVIKYVAIEGNFFKYN